jgi:hypothetical protein
MLTETNEKEQRTANMGRYWGRTLLSSSLSTWQQLFGQDVFQFGF